jgi:nitrite reductase/ring-hydroxylating ferredoxin subunit/uncharacterized membrane protein
MPISAKVLDRLLDRIERLEALDGPSSAAAGVLRRVIRPGPIEDTLSGTPIGHPAHPMLVAVPIGAWTSALVLDAVGADEAATRHLIGIGTLAAVPAALTGASDWLSTAGAERRVGAVHAAANYTALGLQAASWFARRRGDRARGATLSLVATSLVAVGGWLGGHLAYALGVGVDTTAFQKFPEEWTDAAAVAEVGDALSSVEVDGVPILLFRAGGNVVAMADRCSHRGAPLHEGELDGGCVTCPWHDSVFDAAGAVVSGPATRPQPALEVRVVDGRIQVRRNEERSLRKNPVGR